MNNEDLLEHLLTINTLLGEIISEQAEAINQFGNITGKYHPKIISGQATQSDVNKCSGIVQNINRSLGRASDLRNLYDTILKNKSYLPANLNSIVVDLEKQ